MSMKENTNVKLANILFPVGKGQDDCRELFFRASSDNLVCNERGIAVSEGYADFCTYFNGLPVCKWRRYCALSHFRLSLCMTGSGILTLEGLKSGESGPYTISETHFAQSTPELITCEFDSDDFDFIGFKIEPDYGSVIELFSGDYTVCARDRTIRDIKIALCSTTFKKEKYITDNIRKFQSFVHSEFGCASDLFHMFVVDNGRTLDTEVLNSDSVTVIANANVGGSGGFTRGMLEALRSDSSFTHFILMDDDVSVMPESFYRLFVLLSLATDEYRDAFVNGAMLSLGQPYRQFEDVATVSKSGVLCKSKPDYDLRLAKDVLANETAPIDFPHTYGGWWFSAFPVKAIKENGLPLPFFIRCDDVEFGIRNSPIYMTMGGICVWHESFEGRFRPSVDCYQFYRNFLIMNAVDDCVSPRMFIRRIHRSIRQSLRDMDYSAAELTLDGVEDFLKGPDFLKQVDGAKLMKANGSRNELFQPIGRLNSDLLSDAGVDDDVLTRRVYYVKRNILKSLIRSIPYDKHYLPSCLLSKKPRYIVKYGTMTLEGSSALCTNVVVLNATRDVASLRRIDRSRFRLIREREKRLFSRFYREYRVVEKAWKDAFPYMTSTEFWERYLNMA